MRDALENAARAAAASLDAIGPHRDQLLDVLKQFEADVEASGVDVAAGGAKVVEEAADTFGAEYDKLRDILEGLADRAAEALSLAYADLQRDARFTTVMLFGRTRAGKSTTMEALTGGDGASIGAGRQHSTIEVKAYYFPPPPTSAEPDYPCLRIIDTPGIEGFEGEDLAAMAEEFVTRADHIFFVISDDKATATELARFGLIRTQGKEMTILLNVKAKDADLDLLVESPDHVFKVKELDGHARRISGYLRRHFDVPAPMVIPFHARAAWLARSAGKLPEGVRDHESLTTASRIAAVEARILRFILEEAIPARRRAPRDLLNSYLWPLKDELRPFAGRFKKMMRSLREIVGRLECGAERSGRRIAKRFPLLRARFQAANDAIPGVVDEVIVARGDGRTLDARWSQLLRDEGISDCVRWFVEAGRQDFETELKEEVRVAAFEFETSKADNLDDLLGGYFEKDDSAKKKKYARAALRTGAGAGAAALAGWAIVNWWNPTGWAAAAAAAVVVASGAGAEALARSATDEWERATKQDLYAHRGEIIKSLRDRLWEDHGRARARCTDWLEQTKATYLDTARETALPVQCSSERLWRATVSALRGLDEVATALDHELVEEILRSVVPEVALDQVIVKGVARLPSFATKILVSSKLDNVSAFGVCSGEGGRRLGQIVAAVGGEKVDLVDDGASPELRVLQSLSLENLEPRALRIVRIMGNGRSAKARVLLSAKDAAVARGLRNANVRLACQLLGMKIQIATPQ